MNISPVASGILRSSDGRDDHVFELDEIETAGGRVWYYSALLHSRLHHAERIRSFLSVYAVGANAEPVKSSIHDVTDYGDGGVIINGKVLLQTLPNARIRLMLYGKAKQL